MLTAAGTGPDQFVHRQLAAKLQGKRPGRFVVEIRASGVDENFARHQHGQQRRRIRQVNYVHVQRRAPGNAGPESVGVELLKKKKKIGFVCDTESPLQVQVKFYADKFRSLTYKNKTRIYCQKCTRSECCTRIEIKRVVF